MPLSEHEQRLLSEMEQRLVAEDPRFASTMRGSHTGGRSKQRLAVGAIALIAGVGVMGAALHWQLIPVAVLGFVIMLAGVSWALASPRKSGPAGVVNEQGQVRKPKGRAKGSQPGFMNKMENRWDRRREEP